MEQYIPKSAIVVEIEKRIALLEDNSDGIISMLASGMFVNEYKDLLSFLNTLGVKEVEKQGNGNFDRKRGITMTQEDNDLLLKDLCARLPYHVRVKVWLKDGTTEEGFLDLEHNYADVLRDAFYYNKIKDIKPYLRPISSMTEEEKEELRFTYDFSYSNYPFNDEDEDEDSIEGHYEPSVETFDWYNKKMFDYRGLIEKGHALVAPEGIYNNKEEQQ